MTDILKDISTLTFIPLSSLEELVNITNKCMCHSVDEALKSNSNTVNINIGIGIITIFVEENTVRYRFKPSSSLEVSVNSTINDKKSPLIGEIEKSLVDKITNIYKELL